MSDHSVSSSHSNFEKCFDFLRERFRLLKVSLIEYSIRDPLIDKAKQ